jgi:hypothetical protein
MIELTKPISNATLCEAIAIRIDRVFPAMSVANALGGHQDDVWQTIRKYSVAELIAEALDRGINVADIKSSIHGERFIDSQYYLKVRDEIGGRPDFPK